MQIEQGKQAEADQAKDRLARDVAKATLAQMEALFQTDLQILQAKLPHPRDAALESALDMKYLRQRQAMLARIVIVLGL